MQEFHGAQVWQRSVENSAHRRKQWHCQWTCLESGRCSTVSPYCPTDFQKNWNP